MRKSEKGSGEAGMVGVVVGTPYGQVKRYAMGPMVWFASVGELRVSSSSAEAIKEFGGVWRVDEGAWVGHEAEWANEESVRDGYMGAMPSARRDAWTVCQWLAVNGYV